MKTRRKGWIGKTLLALIVAGGAGWYYLQSDKKEERTVFEPAPVTRGTIVLEIRATGIVKPQNRVEIRSSVPGRIEQINVREGDAVQAGQVLALMSSTERAAVLDAARTRGTNELARWQEYYKPITLVAPLDGFIILRETEPGQSVTAADPILAMADQLIVRAQVDETDLAQIHSNQLAVITLDAYPQEPLTARVSHVAFESKTVDNVTIYTADVRPEKIPPFVRSGMTADVKFFGKAARDVLVLPAEAIQAEGGTNRVRVAGAGKKDRPVWIDVQTGLTDGRNVEITAGLAEGQDVLIRRLVTNSVNKVNPFMPFSKPLPRAARRMM